MNQIKEDSQASQNLVAKPGEGKKDYACIEFPDTNTKEVRHASCIRQDCLLVFHIVKSMACVLMFSCIVN